MHVGDPSALAVYDQHGWIQGGEPEKMVDTVAAACAPRPSWKHRVLLMTADHTLCRALSRRIREDLIHLCRDARADRSAPVWTPTPRSMQARPVLYS